MKSTVILLATLVVAFSSWCWAAPDFNVINDSYPYEYVYGRVCPEGFIYAGEDTIKLLGVSYEEVARSPVYSCYKVLGSVGSMSESFNEALSACDDLDADLVAFEDAGEVQRVAEQVTIDPFFGSADYLMTSAMYFTDVEKWIWLGSNQTEVGFNITARNDKEQCLGVASSFSLTFKPIECNQPRLAMCEVRVQTVTYLAWFYSNWLSFLLVMLTILLMSAICISVFKHSAGKRVYRGRRDQNRTARVSVSSLPYNDAPPTYNDVTAGGNSATTSPETTMGKYKNKGKDILAKVTLYRSGGGGAATTS